MSEQPSNVYNLQEYRRLKPDGSLEMGPETDVALHQSELPREGVRQAYEMRETKVIQPTNPNTIHLNPENPIQLLRLMQLILEARIERMKLEDTPFLKDNDLEKAA